MKKVLLLFLFLFCVGISFSQISVKSADYKFTELLDNENYVKNLPEILNLLQDNPDKYYTSKTFNPTIVSSVLANGITDDEETHRHLRNYFGSTDPTIILTSELYLLENL